MSTLVVVYELEGNGRRIVSDALGDAAQAVYLSDLDDAGRAEALRSADAVLARTTRELRQGEIALLKDIRLLQFINAGIDFVPLAEVPAGVPVATNGGAYAEPMAEHALAMALAAAKRLLVEHAALAQRRVQPVRTEPHAGGRGVRHPGVRRHRRRHGAAGARHRHEGARDQPSWPQRGTDRLDRHAGPARPVAGGVRRAGDLHAADAGHQGMIGAAQLARMKDDAILVNVARGEMVDERALYQHLVALPRFPACIDAWWIEPIRHGSFRMDQPFLSLPNVIGSPHNSAAAISGTGAVGLQRAVANIRRALAGEPPHHLVPPEDRMM